MKSEGIETENGDAETIRNIQELRIRLRRGKDFITRIIPNNYCYIDIRDRESGAWSPFANEELDRGHLGICTVLSNYRDIHIYLKKDGQAYLFGYRAGDTHAAFPIKLSAMHCELPHRRRISVPLRKPFENLELYIEYE